MARIKVIDGMKICTRCRENKPVSAFWKHKERISGLQSHCIECKSKWYQENKETQRKATDSWRARHPEKCNEYSKKWRAKYPDRSKAAWTNWAKRNPEAACFKSAKRRAKSSMATPKWANRFFIKEAYSLARLRTKLFGSKWVVDHIVPLQSNLVCGLHVENNMRVITEKQNSAKCNYWWPDMP